MTDEQINQHIAEACGRKRRPDGDWYPDNGSAGTQAILNYCTDLNAMHEAEKVLTKTQWANYMMHYLPSICWAVVTKQDAHQQGNVIHATAAERAEAFGRTLNLWTE